jgi:hypothetical protein
MEGGGRWRGARRMMIKRNREGAKVESRKDREYVARFVR